MNGSARIEGLYELWIVEQTEDIADRAALAPAGFCTDDLDAAKVWAEGFNDRELTEPIGVWAVIRAATSVHQRPAEDRV